MRRFLWGISAASAAVLLAACGGGGGGSGGEASGGASGGAAAAGRLPIEGFWNINEGRAGILITDEGEWWGVTALDDTTFVLTRGNVTVDGNSFTVPVTSYMGRAVGSGRIAGTFSPKATMQALVSGAGHTNYNFTSTYDADYEGTPNLAGLAGTYALVNGGSWTQSAQGAVTGNSDDGCSFSGQVTTDPSGRNYYRVTITFGGAPCALPNATANGVLARSDEDNVLVGGAISGEFGEAFVLVRNDGESTDTSGPAPGESAPAPDSSGGSSGNNGSSGENTTPPPGDNSGAPVPDGSGSESAPAPGGSEAPAPGGDDAPVTGGGGDEAAPAPEPSPAESAPAPGASEAPAPGGDDAPVTGGGGDEAAPEPEPAPV